MNRLAINYMFKILAIAVIVNFLIVPSSWAYLDPGTGSLLLQGIIAVLASISVSITLGWRHIKSVLISLRSRLRKRGGAE